MATPTTNPANPVAKKLSETTRIPMSVPRQKLAVPDIPGYHLHWMRGDQARLQQAIQAGYVFVEDDEVSVVNTNVANDVSSSGNTDMGSRVSIISGSDVDHKGNPSRLYLMKLKQEWWDADQKLLEDRNEQIAATLRGGAITGSNPYGSDNQYIPQSHRNAAANLFTRKK